MTPSDAPPGMLPPPGTDAFPPAAAHPVPVYSRTRWPAALSRWWRAAFAPGAYDEPDGRHRFFPHPAERAGGDAAEDAASPGVPARGA
jgi:hypothetical protein